MKTFRLPLLALMFVLLSSSAALCQADLPVGTIVSTVLNEEQFFELSGAGWILADGRSIYGSELREITGMDHAPDLRGMFLRGMNAGRTDGNQDPDNDRRAGDFQPDMFKSHEHGLSWWASGGMAMPNKYPGINNSYNPNANQGSEKGVTRSGGAETRPKNVSVYFYIKIN